MTIADETTLRDATAFLERQGFEYEEKEEQYCVKLTISRAGKKAHLSIYNSGKIVVAGADSQLKDLLLSFKDAYEKGDGLCPGGVLPFEIDNLPETLSAKIPNIDPVVRRFIEESINAYKANCILSAAFMLGAASEKLIHLLIESFSKSIEDDKQRERFTQRVSKNKVISAKWEEFKKSYSSCKSKPNDPILSQDIDTIIGNIFQFCRIMRNEVGHPQIVPDLDKGVILANIGNFVQYSERIYALMEYFNENKVKL